MAIKFTNNAATTLASGITNVATSLTVASGKGALFPTLSGSDVFYVTLANSSGTVEIVQVTARSTDTFTIVRGQDGTTAVAWNTGDKVELRPTAGVLGAMVQSGQAGGTPSSITLTNGTGLPLTTGVTGTLPIANGGTGLTATPTNGQIDIGNGSGFTRTTLTAGSGISITNGAGSISIASSGGVTSFVGQTGAVDPTVFGAIGGMMSGIPIVSTSAQSGTGTNYTGTQYPNSTIAGSSIAYDVRGLWSYGGNSFPWSLAGNMYHFDPSSAGYGFPSSGTVASNWGFSAGSVATNNIVYSTGLAGSYRCITGAVVAKQFDGMTYTSRWSVGLWVRYA